MILRHLLLVGLTWLVALACVVRAESPKPAETAAAAPAEGLPVPSDADQKASLTLIRQIFKDDIAAAKSADQKSELAKKLLKAAIDEGTAPADRYVLLVMARDLAADSADIPTGIEAVTQMAVRYQRTADAIVAESMPRLIKAFPRNGDPSPVIQPLMTLVDKSVKADRYELARTLIAQAQMLATRTNNTAASTLLSARLTDIRRSEQLFNESRAARVTLEKNPNDPAAHLAVGRFLCFIKADWEQGIPHLAAGSDTTLKSLAQQELAPDAATKAEAIADGWWNLGDKEQGRTRDQLYVRSARWYRDAVPNLKGLAKTRAEKRIEQAGRSEIAQSIGSPSISITPVKAKVMTASWIAPDEPKGIKWFRHGDSQYTPEKLDGKDAIRSSMYYYFDIDDKFVFDLPRELDERVFVKIRYFDEKESKIWVLYDGQGAPESTDPGKHWQRALVPIECRGTGEWVERLVELEAPRLGGGLHLKTDIRLDPNKPVPPIGGITVERMKIRPLAQRTIKPGTVIDLMPLTDPDYDTWTGNWKKQDGAFVCAQGSWHGLTFPVIPQGNYQIETTFTRLKGGNCVYCKLPLPNSRWVDFDIDWGDGKSGLATVNDKHLNDPANPTVINHRFLTDGKPAVLIATVTFQGDNVTIKSELDGKPFVQWTGPYALLKAGPTSRLGALGVMSHVTSSLRIDSFKLKMLTGTAVLLH